MCFQNKYPRRATLWRLKSTELRFGKVPAVMGIVNVTPDSFSDGGQFLDHDRAIDHALQLVDEGAHIIDIGGESTRPNAAPVSEQEELDRVLTVIQRLSEQTSVPISIDTSKAKVAAESLAAGAQIINDVTGLEGDPSMIDVARDTGAGVCAMHMRGTPRSMLSDANTTYNDPVQDVCNYLRDRLNMMVRNGLDFERICVDPGIGFAKNHQQNLFLLAGIGGFHELQAPLLVGHSRKGFLARILNDSASDRTAATIGVSMMLAHRGVQVLRVHDVLATRHALLSFAASGGIDGEPAKLD